MVDLTRSWGALLEEVGSRSHRLVTEAAEAWSHLEQLSRLLDRRLRAQEPFPPLTAGTESLEALFSGLAERLLLEPLALYRKKPPLAAVVSAIQEFDEVLDGVVQRLPATSPVSSYELAALLGARGGRGWFRGRWRRWQRYAGTIPFRSLVADHLQRHCLRRGVIEGALQLVLAQSSLHLLGPWQIYREHTLRLLSGARRPGALEEERRRWAAKTDEHARRMAPLLAAYETWANSAAHRLASAVIAGLSEPFPRVRMQRAARQRQRLMYWARQQRAVCAILDLEAALAALAADTARISADALASLQLERAQLLRELDNAIGWLESASPGAEQFPPPQVNLVPPQARANDWERRILDDSRSRLPGVIEIAEPRSPLPGRRTPWRELQPGKVFSAALVRVGTLRVLSAFRDATAVHQHLIREIEHAREVVAYGVETARSEGPAGEAAAREAFQNAVALLRHQRDSTPEADTATATALAQAVATVLLQCHLSLEQGRLGLFAHLSRQHGLEAVNQLRQLCLTALRASARRAWLMARRWSEQILIRIGWLAPPRRRLDPVSERARLGQVLDLRLHERELPVLYRRLFRLTPVDDPRFLVGREAEMAGLVDAFARWNSGLRGSAVVVGARGSGKTSLLNCAAAGLFADTLMVRGRLSGRLSDAGRMHGLLRDLLQLPAGSDAAAGLAEKRRVVIIEELERSFLRVINGFEALRELLTLVYRTSGTTFWVFSINETAFRYLDAVVGLARHFSHRINAMSVSREVLIGAIRQRHDLTGLSLEFAPPPTEDPRVSRARRLLGLEHNPEDLFFDSLYRQSEGLFRSAFELWQGSIARVEAGVVHMRQPLIPNYGPLLSELDQQDQFLLQAILQHGALTAEEAAQVTRWTVPESERRLERLRVLEILEPEPQDPGLRIRPEAGRFVREALHRQNLW